MSAPRVAGIGVAAPPRSVGAEEGAQIALRARSGHDPDDVQALYRESGVASRGSVMTSEALLDEARGERGPTTRERLARYAPAAADLARGAASRALDCARIESDRITHLITVSCTGAESPGLDHALIERLALSPGVSRTHVGFMGCHGALNALRIADAFVRADSDAAALVVCCELCSLHYQTGPVSRDQLVANAIFADGAGAAVVNARPDAPRVASFASRLFDASADLMRWSIGDFGFQMRLSARVPVALRRGIAPWIDEWLAAHALARADVGAWAVHPGGRDILECVERGLGLDAGATAASRSVYRAHGNMSSATVLWVLDALIRERAPFPIVALSFGPGLTGEAMLLHAP